MDSLITVGARATLEEHGDRVNAAHARYLEVRRLLLIMSTPFFGNSMATASKACWTKATVSDTSGARIRRVPVATPSRSALRAKMEEESITASSTWFFSRWLAFHSCQASSFCPRHFNMCLTERLHSNVRP
jgi:hypothetical protein